MGKKKKFEVQPGDVMSVLVCAPESKHGYVNMWNHRTNEIVSIGVSTGKIDGSTVDWIVEAPYTMHLPTLRCSRRQASC